MKIQTKNGELNLELDGIGKNGKIKFVGGVSMPLGAIENWIDVLVEFAEDVLCFDSVAATEKNTIVLKEDLFSHPDNLFGGLEQAIELMKQFVDTIAKLDVYIDDFAYSMSPENEALQLTLWLSLPVE